MRVVIRPGSARGTVAAPPSKSMAHRLLICAGLADGLSEIRHIHPSEDILATLDCLQALGVGITSMDKSVRIRGVDPRKIVAALLPCRESGSTLRFLLPVCLLSGSPVRFSGNGILLTRPLSVYQEICAEQGLRFELGERELMVEGRLRPGIFNIPGNISSQFVSGLLFSLPLLEDDSTIRLIPPVDSRSYIDMTVSTLKDFGIAVRWLDTQTLFIPGRSAYIPHNSIVEGDWSSAAFFEALNVLGSSIRVTNLQQDSLQSDRVYPSYFARLIQDHAVLDVTDCPDLAPVLLAVAAAKNGCTLIGTRRLQYKESNRGAAMTEELAKFGIRIDVGENAIHMVHSSLHTPEKILSSHNDHRIAMALSVLCTRTGGEIDGAEAVRKSFPEYWDQLRNLGIELEIS